MIHFALSVLYAFVPVSLVGHLRGWVALAAGGLYGLMIYVVNLYGLTMLFPWFSVARDWITLIAHLVFGLALAAACLLLAGKSDRFSR